MIDVRKVIVLILTSLTILMGSAVGEDSPDTKLLPVRVERGISYATYGKETLKLDLAMPKEGGPFPAIILLHGGAWRMGSRTELSKGEQAATGQSGPSMIETIASHGYVVASASYRFAPKNKFPAQLQDTRTAIRFLRANAETYHINPERLAVGGFSSGGHLALLAGLADKSAEFDGTEYPDQSNRVQCVVSFFGPTDLSLYGLSPGLEEVYMFPLLGKECRTDPAVYRRASPIHHVSRDDPPVLMIHGNIDLIVPIIHSERLLDKLHETGVKAELITVKGEGHGWDGPAAKKSTLDAIRFFDEYLKGKK